MKTYDYLIAGGGCAGLAMALQLLTKVNSQARILIVDREKKTQNDRSWAFWAASELPLRLDSIVHHRWQKLAFCSTYYQRTAALNTYTYRFIRGIDYYNFCYESLRAFPNVEYILGDINNVQQDGTRPCAWVSGRKIQADWIFDSRLAIHPKVIQEKGQFFLWQHFRGWTIETKHNHFDPKVATLMDFSTNEDGNTAFFYVLPFSQRRALVEFTLFDQQLLTTEIYEKSIADYLDKKGIKDWRVIETEAGKIPMTNAHFAPTSTYPNIVPIGALGGAIKPTTGYAFIRIQQQVEAFATQLARIGKIQKQKYRYSRFQWYDDLLLQILTTKPDKGREIFSRLFKKQSFDRILRFLAENSSLAQEVLLFKDLPIRLFLEAATQLWQRNNQLTTPPLTTPYQKLSR